MMLRTSDHHVIFTILLSFPSRLQQ